MGRHWDLGSPLDVFLTVLDPQTSVFVTLGVHFGTLRSILVTRGSQGGSKREPVAKMSDFGRKAAPQLGPFGLPWAALGLF